jgi:branched-chain amino acid transport system permease protein
LILLTLPLFVGPFLATAMDTVGIYILLGLGLNIVVGFAGLLDLGYVAFYAVGAYATAVLTSPVSPAFAPGFNFWLAVPLVMLIAAVIGLTIGAPVLRLRGDYLAIVTLGFGEIARIIFLSDWMTPYLGGAQGILQIPAPNIFGIDLRDPALLYYPILVACVIAAVAAVSLASSRVGRAWTAMREDESVAEATGINTTKYKLLAFSLGATFGGLAGALYAVRIGSVFPQELNIIVSINALALIILGGIGSIPGVIVGAVVLVGLPELLREFSEYRLLVYGIVLVAMMLLRPEGLLPNRSRRAELHEGEDSGDAGGWDEKRWEREAGAETPEPLIT